MKLTRDKQKKIQGQSKPTKKKEFVETKENLLLLLSEHKKLLERSTFQAKRLADLLSRKSALKRNPAKKAKMEKYYAEAQEEISFAKSAIDQIEFRISMVS